MSAHVILPGAQDQLIPRQVKGQLGVVSHTEVGKKRDPRAESCRRREKREESEAEMVIRRAAAIVIGD